MAPEDSPAPTASPPESSSPPSPSPDTPRRGFIGGLIGIVLALGALAVPAVTALIAYLNPVRQRSPGGKFYRLTTLAALPEDGSPRKFPVITDRIDAWNRYPEEPIGSVFVRRTGDEKTPVEAFQVICPHAGCSITFESGDEGGMFVCPCHAAYFDLAGHRTQASSPSPRDMDTLEVEIRNDNQVWVKFQNFVTGTSSKTVAS
jgi:menaquinol-cytochrome c reductase iron-sulfur subunit